MLTTLDEAVLSCKSKSARAQITEAVRCYEAGAYRSAIVMAYVAVCYDLIDKLRALSSGGDGRASTLLADLAKYQNQLDAGNEQALVSLLKFERELIEKFRDDFEFFGINEYEELTRLRGDRNRCAHPTFFKSEEPYSPSAELARLHISNAIRFVLSQEPKQGKAALSQVQSVIMSQYFPDEIEEIVERLKLLGLENARTPLIHAIADDIVFNSADDSHPYFMFVPAYKAVDALIELHRSTASPRVTQNVEKLLKSGSDDAIQAGSLFVLRNVDVQNDIAERARKVVGSWVEKTDRPKTGNMVLRAINIDWLKESALKRLEQLESDDFTYLQRPVPNEMLDRAVSLYVAARSWDSANTLAPKVAIPFADAFNEVQVRRIFDEATNGSADLRGSHSFGEFIEKLYLESPLGKAKLDALTDEFDLVNYRPE